MPTETAEPVEQQQPTNEKRLKKKHKKHKKRGKRDELAGKEVPTKKRHAEDAIELPKKKKKKKKNKDTAQDAPTTPAALAAQPPTSAAPVPTSNYAPTRHHRIDALAQPPPAQDTAAHTVQEVVSAATHSPGAVLVDNTAIAQPYPGMEDQHPLLYDDAPMLDTAMHHHMPHTLPVMDTTMLAIHHDHQHNGHLDINHDINHIPAMAVDHGVVHGVPAHHHHHPLILQPADLEQQEVVAGGYHAEAPAAGGGEGGDVMGVPIVRTYVDLQGEEGIHGIGCVLLCGLCVYCCVFCTG